MKTVKSLILGSAAALFAMSGAQAADLPIKAKAVEYVKVCSLYGAGFYYIPGTDTCIKLGGYVRADYTGAGGDYGFMQSSGTGNGGSNNRLTNYWTTRARMDFNVDTRTATEYGVVRTFADMVFTVDSGTAGAGAAAGLGLYHAFIQFAGFTFGRTVSIFDMPWQGYPAGGPDTVPGGSNHVTGINQVAYTADFGQGVTASIALEDPTTPGNGQANVFNTSLPLTAGQFQSGIYGTNSWGGSRSPDIVGAVRVDQAWGLFQFGVAAHDIHPTFYGTTETTGHPSDKWGWAVQAGLSIKNIPTGPGDSINMQAVYADGDIHAVLGNIAWPLNFGMYSGSTTAYQSVGFASLVDGVFGAAGTQIETSKAWGFRGGYTHNWSPNWATGVYGGYAQVRYGAAGAALICNNFATLGPSVGAVCNPDFNVATVGANVVWTPVKNLAFTADVHWMNLDQKYSGTISGANTAVAAFGKPAATYELKDQNSLNFLLRAQRNF
ncbi:porin [Bradyrhizobium sp. HKCCYLS2038]|uniref:porin n=1 Tax=unclassified Bradyrhizobium TaxID=2631580 RepID=UPI003EB72AC5